MNTKNKAFLIDLGGTHIRLAMLGERGALENIQKFAVADFKTLPEALEHYTAEKGALYIATAAWPYPDGTWRFARPGRWHVSLPDLQQAGWQVAYIGNDFAAGARGALALAPEFLYNIRMARPSDIPQARSAVLGCGTGLGLAYVCEGRVHETYGGHMDIPQRTDEQHTVIKLIGRLKDDERPVSAEDLISGSGLVLLYKAACMIHGQRPLPVDPAQLLADKNDFLFAHALRLFHEFLGLFAHQAVIYGHAYAGLYMDGGVLHRLIENYAFDAERFLEFFIGDPLPLIKSRIEAMAVNIVTDPYAALQGLVEIKREMDNA